MNRKSKSSSSWRTAARPVADAPAVFTISNAVLVAVLQVAVVVMGCLAAATSYRVTEPLGGMIRLPTLLLRDYWFCFMAVPLLWITSALGLRRRPEVSNDAKGTIFWFGVFLLAALILLSLCGFFGQLFVPTADLGGEG
jgi:hypothetical protein